MRLTIYGDFNCPFSTLASARADVLIARGTHQIEWRAIQHDTSIPSAGEPVDSNTGLAAEVATILELSEQNVRLKLPTVRSNTALACAAFAAASDADKLRQRLFAAIWAEDRNLGNPTELRRLDATGADPALARRWQDVFDALPQAIAPTLVLADGYVSRGLGALARLADLATEVP